MNTPPSGTVTFLFTDIEGSTKLAREHPETWETMRSCHHQILHNAIESNHGFVFQVIGDAFCASFHRAGDALSAAVEAQIALQNEPLKDCAIRVRMGIHTGEAEQRDGEYQGYLTLSYVQRLMSAGHGRQILLSEATENLLRGQLPKEIDLLDLGKHKLKDIPQSVQVFQVVAPGLQAKFPFLRTPHTRPNNLHLQLTSFVGREKELGDIKRLLQNGHLLTLIGPGGTGKTRLSLQVASEMLDQYTDGVWFVELASLLDASLVPRTTAITIGLQDEPQRPIVDMLCDYLRDKKLLLLLDNCEHVVEACAHMVNKILQAAPHVRILASSREALGIAGEVTYRVPALDFPELTILPTVEILSQYEAVKLFIDRATSAVPSFTVTNENAPAVAQICHRLDGIPLAIELAAAKLRVLRVDQIAQRLDDRFRLLTGGSRTALERHQTLRAAIDWSYNLLPAAEQLLFRRLSAFVGGWTLEAAEFVCQGESFKSEDVLSLLEQLINKSLVNMNLNQAESSYSMLETIRQYANEKLMESGESDALRDRHLAYFMELAETAEPHLVRPEQLEWLAKLEADYENLRLALEWALSNPSSEPSLRLCSALGRFWVLRQSHCMEGSKWLASALAKHFSDGGDNLWYVRALCRDAEVAEMLDDLQRLKSSAELAFRLAKAGSDPRDLAIARFFVGWVFFRHAEWEQAQPYFEQSIKEFQDVQDVYWEAFSHRWLSSLKANQGDPDIRRFGLHSVTLARQAGERTNLARALLNYAEILFSDERTREAIAYLDESIALSNEFGPNSLISILAQTYLARIAWFDGDHQAARSLFLNALMYLRLLGDRYTYGECSRDFGVLCLHERDFSQAQAYLEEALSISQELNLRYSITNCLTWLGILFDLEGDVQKAKHSLMESITLVRDTDRRFKKHLLESLFVSPYFQTSLNSVKLLGALRSFHSKSHILKNRWLERYTISTETQLRAELGRFAFESAFGEGEKFSLDQALDLAQDMIEAM